MNYRQILSAIFVLLASSSQTAAGSEPIPIEDAEEILATATGMDEHVVLSAELMRFPFLRRSILIVKFVELNGLPGTLALSDDGEVILDGGVALRAAEVEARFDFQGALSDELLELAVHSEATTRIPSAIWLRTFEPLPAREDLITDPFLAQTVAWENSEVRRQASARLLADWDSIADTTVIVGPDTPVAFAELTPDELFTLADHPVVAAIYWDGGGEPQWTTYVDTINANSTGFDGSLRRVCVVEPHEPLVPNTLTITGRFCAGGTTDSHGNIVAGVIRSTAFPLGSASDATIDFCDFLGCGSTSANAGFAWCASRGADLWNFSHSCSTVDNRLIDYRSKQAPYPLTSWEPQETYRVIRPAIAPPPAPTREAMSHVDFSTVLWWVAPMTAATKSERPIGSGASLAT